jgi:hypothetical protein
MVTRFVCSAALAALLTSPLAAADKNDKNLADKDPKALKLFQKDALAGFKLPKGIELSAGQQEKLAALKARVAPKLAELQKQIDAVITKERRQAQSAAMQKAKAAGKDKKEILQAGQEALRLTDDEAATLQQLQALLTDEQEAKLAELKGKGTDKNKNPKPDKGVKPVKGSRGDKGFKPDKGPALDKNVKNLKKVKDLKSIKDLKRVKNLKKVKDFKNVESLKDLKNVK